MGSSKKHRENIKNFNIKSLKSNKKCISIQEQIESFDKNKLKPANIFNFFTQEEKDDIFKDYNYQQRLNEVLVDEEKFQPFESDVEYAPFENNTYLNGEIDLELGLNGENAIYEYNEDQFSPIFDISNNPVYDPTEPLIEQTDKIDFDIDECLNTFNSPENTKKYDTSNNPFDDLETLFNNNNENISTDLVVYNENNNNEYELMKMN